MDSWASVSAGNFHERFYHCLIHVHRISACWYFNRNNCTHICFPQKHINVLRAADLYLCHSRARLDSQVSTENPVYSVAGLCRKQGCRDQYCPRIQSVLRTPPSLLPPRAHGTVGLPGIVCSQPGVLSLLVLTGDTDKGCIQIRANYVTTWIGVNKKTWEPVVRIIILTKVNIP